MNHITRLVIWFHTLLSSYVNATLYIVILLVEVQLGTWLDSRTHALTLTNLNSLHYRETVVGFCPGPPDSNHLLAFCDHFFQGTMRLNVQFRCLGNMFPICLSVVLNQLKQQDRRRQQCGRICVWVSRVRCLTSCQLASCTSNSTHETNGKVF